MVILVVLAVIIVLFALVCLFLNQPSFGRLPRGERLVRIERSPNFKDGEFKNECVPGEDNRGLRHASLSE